MMKTNLKKERLLEERYTEIDRENQHLLRKMADAMKQRPHERKEENRPTTLNRSGRKAELLRITKENHRMLKSIQEVQPVYSAKKWEKHFQESEVLLRNKCTYPVITRLPRARSEPSILMPMDPERTQGSSGSGAPGAGTEEGVVLKEGKLIGSVYYLLEMSTDGRALTISAYDGQTQTSLELIVKESKHRQLYRECSGDYSQIAARLRVDGNRLVLDSPALEQL
jgi:E3 ubiquitin-protein ligase TRIP12